MAWVTRHFVSCGGYTVGALSGWQGSAEALPYLDFKLDKAATTATCLNADHSVDGPFIHLPAPICGAVLQVVHACRAFDLGGQRPVNSVLPLQQPASALTRRDYVRRRQLTALQAQRYA